MLKSIGAWLAQASALALVAADALRRWTRSSAQPHADPARIPTIKTGRVVDAAKIESSAKQEEQDQQVRQLIKQALDSPTAEDLANFLDFTTRFRRLSVWNAPMAYIQRPGASVIASDSREAATASSAARPSGITPPATRLTISA